MSQQQVADRLAIRPTAFSNWEKGTRMISVGFDQIDAALEGGGALEGLLWSLGTPEGLDPSRIWTAVFPGPSSPVWMWIRATAPSIGIEAEWGVFRLEAHLDMASNGIVVPVGGSVADSPVVTQLSTPGWIDFGRGPMPPAVPGAEVIDALELARPSTATGMFMDLFNANAERLTGDRTRGASGERLSQFYAGYVERRTDAPVAGPWPPLPEGLDATERLRFARLRQARGLSLAAGVERLAARTGTSIGKDTLRRFENNQGEPHDRLLPAALDAVLGASGHLVVMELRSATGPMTVQIPRYWLAPIWLAFDVPDGDPPPALLWGKWWRRIELASPMLVVSHYAEPESPLKIVVGPRTRWTLGLGRRKGAIPINQGWVPVSVDAAHQAMSEAESAVLDALRQAEENESG